MERNPFENPQPKDEFYSYRSGHVKQITYLIDHYEKRVHFKIIMPSGQSRHDFMLWEEWQTYVKSQKLDYLTKGLRIPNIKETFPETSPPVEGYRNPFIDPIKGDVVMSHDSKSIRTVDSIKVSHYSGLTYINYTAQDARGRDRKYRNRSIDMWRRYCKKNNVEVVQYGKE